MFLGSILLGNLEILWIESFICFGKDRGRQIPKIRLFFGKPWIWDKYLPNNMKWKFGNMGSLSIKKHELEILNMGSIYQNTWIWELRNIQLNVFFNIWTSFFMSNKRNSNIWILFYFQLREFAPHPTTFRFPPMHQPPSSGWIL